MSFSNPNLLTAQDASFEQESTLGNWAGGAGSNTTAHRGGPATGFDGDYYMYLTATVAGSVSVTNRRRIPVAVGAQHVSRAMLVVAQEGITASIRVTYYDASADGTALGTFEHGRVLTPGVANWTSVCGTAPSGATHAELTILADGVPAGGNVAIDAVYFGVAAVIPNNFYTYNQQSFEQDASDWWFVNATAMPSQVYEPPAGWGEWMCQAVADGEGDMLTGTINTFPVVPGVDYVGYAQILADEDTDPFSGVVAEMLFYDEEENPIGDPVASSPIDIPTNLSFVPMTVTGTAPPGSVSARVQYKFPECVTGQTWYMDEAYFGPTSNEPGNLLSYLEYSFEGALPPTTITGGSVSLGELNLTNTDGFWGAFVTPDDGADVVDLWNDRLVPITSGRTYKVRYKVATYSDGDPNARITAIPLVEWYDADQELMSTDAPDQPYTVDGGSQWTTLDTSQTRTAPGGAAYVRIGVRIDTSDSVALSYGLDQVYVVSTSPEYVLVSDDDTGSVVLTVHYVPPTGLTGYYTVDRVDEDGSRVRVRGYDDFTPFTETPFVVEDYEAPLGTKIWYSVTWYGEDKLPFPTSTRLNTRRIDSPVLEDPDFVWFKSPGIPAVNTRVMMENAITWSRTARTATYEIVGRKNPVNVTGVRGGRKADITVLIWDEASHYTFDALLDSGLPALIQAMPGFGVNANLYLSVGDVTAEPVMGAANVPGWRWTLSITEIDRPVGGIQGSALSTWQKVYDDYATWEDVFEGFDTWADVLTKG